MKGVSQRFLGLGFQRGGCLCRVLHHIVKLSISDELIHNICKIQ